jgi:mono/diheme cytochrome c family protein
VLAALGVLSCDLLDSTVALAEPKSPRTVYLENCALCHGDDARGVYGPDYYGPNLVGNAFVRGLSDDELLQFLKIGRAADAPTSTMHVMMPPCDYLSAAELMAVVHFLRDGN